MARVYRGRELVERQADSKITGFVYFMQAVPDGLIKIGWSASHPDARLKRIRATSPVPIAPLAMMRGGRGHEAGLHARFLDLWSHGEWFRPASELVEHIAEIGEPWPDPETRNRRPPVDGANLELAMTGEELELAKWAKRTNCDYQGVKRTLLEWSQDLGIPLAMMKRWVDEGVKVDLIGHFMRLRQPTP